MRGLLTALALAAATMLGGLFGLPATAAAAATPSVSSLGYAQGCDCGDDNGDDNGDKNGDDGWDWDMLPRHIDWN